jgi:hypothetical protein
MKHFPRPRPEPTSEKFRVVCDICGPWSTRHTTAEHRRHGGGLGLFYLVAHRSPGFSAADLANEPLLAPEDAGDVEPLLDS